MQGPDRGPVRGRDGQKLNPLMETGRAMLPARPGFPDAAEPPRCVTVTAASGVPAVRFGFTSTDELELPPDALALGLPPGRVRSTCRELSRMQRQQSLWRTRSLRLPPLPSRNRRR